MTEAALQAAERAAAAQPDDPGAWYRLGLARLDSGLLEQSEACWRRVLALDPRHAKARVNLGLVLQHTGRAEEGLQRYREAAAADPGLAQAWFNLGALLIERGQALEAVEPLRTALRLEQGRAEWHAALGTALRESGSPRDAVACLRAALRLDPSMHRAHSELLQALSSIPSLSQQEICDEHREWARRHGSGPRFPDHANSRQPDRRLRIGYLAADFREPSIAFCLRPVLAWHDRSGFEIFCYSDAAAHDPVSWRLRARDVAWRASAGLSNDQLGEAIREDRIDILVDLTGHAAGGARVPLLARKPVPVQASWLGCPGGTGLEAIDYRITDAHADPDGVDRFFAERLVRLPQSQCCFKPEFGAPAPDAPRKAALAFGAEQRLSALTPEVIGLWARVLERAPGSRLLLDLPRAGSASAHVIERCAAAGADPGRIEIRTGSAAAPGSFDVALDVFPCSDAAGALRALWSGTPVVTLEGAAPASRVAAGILRVLGLDELVARDEAGYVEIAAVLARDRERLSRLRAGLRARLERSPLMQQERFTRCLEAAYRRMWRAWCGGEPARPMQIEPPAAGAATAAAPTARRASTGARPLRVVVDGVFFQEFSTGISRVWQSLLQVWVANRFAERVLLLDRDNTAPPIAGVKRRTVPRHSYDRLEEDREMLQRVCDEENATVFASTYYTSPLETPSVMMVYDMIPEVGGADLGEPMWREKAHCLHRASRLIAISRNTASDLCDFYPEIRPQTVTVAHCGVSLLFRQAGAAEVDAFRRQHGITRPYFLLVGGRKGYKNAEVFLRAFARLPGRDRFAVVCVGGNAEP
ncbi:MAG: tetratricopeptide repeat protein, partial [Pseudomonadota bacterium]